MADIVAELADRGHALTPEDRSRLVELLLESLHEPPLSAIEAAWDAEIVRRVVQRACFKAQFVEHQQRRLQPRGSRLHPS